MATVTRESIGLLNEKIVVRVAKDDYLPSFQKAIKDYSKKANIPGFRKGMVPVGMVKKMYGTSVFAEEVYKSVEKGLTDYMTNEKLQIFAQPLPLPENEAPKLDMNQPDEYQFSFEVGIKPEFDIADLSKAELTRYKVEVTDEMIKEQLDYLQTRFEKTTEVETVNSEDNALKLTFIESDAEGNELDGGIKKDINLKINQILPEERNAFIGKKTGDTVLIQLSKTFSESEKAILLSDFGFSKDEQEVHDKFNLTINAVEEFEKPLFNEDFFKQVYPDKEIASEEDLRNEIKKEIETSWEVQSRNQLVDQIYHELLNHSTIEFPEDFLKRWMLTGTEKQKTQEEVEKEFPVFVNQLKWTLITDKIVLEKDIEVNQGDIADFAKAQLFSYMGGGTSNIEEPWVNDYIERMMKDKKFVQDSFHRIQTDKIFAWAETQVHPTEATITADDFRKMLEAHQHEH